MIFPKSSVGGVFALLSLLILIFLLRGRTAGLRGTPDIQLKGCNLAVGNSEDPVRAAIGISSAYARGALLSPGNALLPFDDVKVSLPLSPPLAVPFETDGVGSGFIKLLAAPELLKLKGKRCLVYGLGIADNCRFEVDMARLGCTVHAFDCTSDESAIGNMIAGAGVDVKLHPWCVGTSRSFEGNIYSTNKMNEEARKGKDFGTGDGSKSTRSSHGKISPVFLSLVEIQLKLGHSDIAVDVLKFDIEGWEWELLYKEVLSAPAHLRPNQLIFELHTEGANPLYVPPAAVQGKTSASVNALFLALWDAGYRVISKVINPGDDRCAEFTLVRVFD